MRSDLIFGALTHVNNRYKLCQLASKATRKLHKPNTRLQDTTNEVLDRFKDTVPMDMAAEGIDPRPRSGAPRRIAEKLLPRGFSRAAVLFLTPFWYPLPKSSISLRNTQDHSHSL